MSTSGYPQYSVGPERAPGGKWRDFAIAALAALAAIILRWSLNPIAGGRYAFASTIIAVVLVSWHVDWFPALVTLAIGFALADWQFVPPIHQFRLGDPENIGQIATVWLIGLTIIFFGRSMRLARARADAHARQVISNQKELEREVAERRRAESEVRRLNAELEERVILRTAELQASNQELEAFTYSVSHDLRAPLRHMDGFAQILEEEYGPKLPPDACRCITRIRRGSQNLGQLVDDLLDLSRVGKQDVNRQPVDLKKLAESVAAEVQAQTPDRKIAWRIGNLPTLPCDPGLTRIVFANLLSNAAKYTRPREAANVEVDFTETGGEKAVRVRDNGVGFDMKYADKLFGVFQRLHRAEEFEGTGVGLATVQRIVRKHGGRIWAEAEVNKGATFSFTLESPSKSAESITTQNNGQSTA
jgi:signal transduction histidine kinase